MKLRIADRILVAIAGLLILALCAGIISQLFLQVDVIAWVAKVFENDTLEIRAVLIGLAVFLLLLGVYCVFVLFRHRKRKDKFILQKNDSGELAISIKALESMVQKCLDQHDEIKVQHLYLENKKDGLLIRIRGAVAGGISIPLTVEALQKQIKQYVTACSGVEVKGIRVQIENSGKDAENAPFAIEAPSSTPLLKESDNKLKSSSDADSKQQTEYVDRSAAASQVTFESPVEDLNDEEDGRPLHQRLFSTKQEPCIVPEPPVSVQTESGEGAAASSTESQNQNDKLQSENEEQLLTPTPALEEAEDEEKTITTEESKDRDTSQLITEGLSKEEQDALIAEAEGKNDPDFRESLKAFDNLLTGEKE